MSRTYWRSLAQIEDLPEYRAALEREFPEGASELPDVISRRDMILLVGASLSLAGPAGSAEVTLLRKTGGWVVADVLFAPSRAPAC